MKLNVGQFSTDKRKFTQVIIKLRKCFPQETNMATRLESFKRGFMENKTISAPLVTLHIAVYKLQDNL